MIEYVLCFAEPHFSRRHHGEILVVEKKKPKWQAGRLNLVGGKVEAGEAPMEAALRELKEESGLTIYDSTINRVMGKIHGVDCVIYCCMTCVQGRSDDPYLTIKQGPNEIENVFWMEWFDLRDDKRILPNLKVIVPLMLAGVDGWEITDQCCSAIYNDREVHEIGIRLDVEMAFTNAPKLESIHT